MSIEAMKQALEALERVALQPHGPSVANAIIALRAAIEQAEKQDHIKLEAAYLNGLTDGKEIVEREWVGLTDEEYKIIHNKNYNYEELAKAVEAKLEEKNS